MEPKKMIDTSNGPIYKYQHFEEGEDYDFVELINTSDTNEYIRRLLFKCGMNFSDLIFAMQDYHNRNIK